MLAERYMNDTNFIGGQTSRHAKIGFLNLSKRSSLYPHLE